MQKKFFVAFVISLFSMVGVVVAQTTDASIKPVYKSGDVESIATDKIVIKTASGVVDIVLNDKTEFKRVSVEKPSLATATAVARTEISAGDKVAVSCLANADGKSLWGRTVYLMTKADISQKAAKETAEWRTRGISGKVMTANVETKQIVVEVSGMVSKTNVTLTPKSDAKFLRYSSDSVKFTDAKMSSILEVKAGDQIRAIGDKSTDGAAFTAETILTGSFRQTAGTVKSIDVANNEVVVKDLATNKDVTIAFGDAILLKRFPPEMAERMAGAQMPGAVRPPGVPAQGPPQGVQPPANGQPQSQGRMMGGGARGGIDEMIERFPNITAVDLKVGDAIAVLTSGSQANVGKIKAIKLLAGVEPFIKMAQAAAAQAGRGQGGGNQPGLNIPGLDGIGVP